MKNLIHEELQSQGLKPTKARVTMLELFKSSSKPIDIDTIREYLDKKSVSTDQATIYRFVNSCIQEGILRRIEFGEGKYRYELSSLPHHHHLVCNQCGNVDDVEFKENDFTQDIGKKTNFKIDHHHLEFFGLCSNCQ